MDLTLLEAIRRCLCKEYSGMHRGLRKVSLSLVAEKVLTLESVDSGVSIIVTVQNHFQGLSIPDRSQSVPNT